MRRREFLAAPLAVQGLLATPATAWDTQRIGANCFNRRVTTQWIDAAAAAGIRLVRLAYDKWGPRDYLLGSAESYQQLVPAHLQHLIAILDRFAARNMAVILVPLTLPGARWRQKNNGLRDDRLWQDRKYWMQALRFWRDLAKALRGHPAIAAYDLLNEPAPELSSGKRSFWTGSYPDWQQRVRGTAADLNAFNRELVAGIRHVDETLPLILETGLYATPFEVLEPLSDPNLLYSVHMYEPYNFTTWRINRGKLHYPGPIRIEDTGKTLEADASWIHVFLEPLRQWTRANGIPANRILVPNPSVREARKGGGVRRRATERGLCDKFRYFCSSPRG